MSVRLNKRNIEIQGRVRATLRDVHTKEIIYQSKWQENIIPDVGLSAIARRFGGVGLKANEGQVTYGAVGNGVNTPSNSDTQMENEIARILIATQELTDIGIILIETYFTSSEAIGDITKFALFGEDASASANSGTLMEYVDFDIPFTKTSNMDLTIQSVISFKVGE